MSSDLRRRLFTELDSIRLIDPHSHIEPKTAASKTLADILGYHYYTELIHSAGMPRTEIEEPGLDPKEKVRRLVARIEPLRNTVQYSWLLELARTFFDFPADEHLTSSNWEILYDTAAKKMAQPDWEQQVLDRGGFDIPQSRHRDREHRPFHRQRDRFQAHGGRRQESHHLRSGEE